MKKIFASLMLVALSLTIALTVNAQAAESIWLQADTTTYKTKETIIVTVNGISATPIQGFTAQIRYDPACLEPVNSVSPISGMNGLPVPQVSGLADLSFASTTPQMANGALAEVRFTALKGCQTSLHMESAALVIRNESGFAAPIPGVNVTQNSIAVNIDSTMGIPQPTASGNSALSLAPNSFPKTQPLDWKVIAWASMAGVLVLFVAGLYKLMGSTAR